MELRFICRFSDVFLFLLSIFPRPMKHLKDRTKRFAIDVIQFCNSLPNDGVYRVVKNQLLRSGTSVAANYRAACRAQSRAAFIAKLAIVEEEADESEFWLELIEEIGTNKNPLLIKLKKEASQITAIIVASKKTARNRK